VSSRSVGRALGPYAQSAVPGFHGSGLGPIAVLIGPSWLMRGSHHPGILQQTSRLRGGPPAACHAKHGRCLRPTGLQSCRRCHLQSDSPKGNK